jgi:purine-binding chemotaxis protein CheW
VNSSTFEYDWDEFRRKIDRKAGRNIMSKKIGGAASQYLSFKLDEEIFALDVAKVREVLECTTLTKVPRTPEYLRGVINLRGSVVPVVDMRLMFGMEPTERTVDTCIVVTEVSLDGETVVLGAMADSVQEVMEIAPDRIEPVPVIRTGVCMDFFRGMYNLGSRFVMILDMNRFFPSGDQPP